MADQGSNINIEEVFVSLRRAWHPPSAAVEASFTRLTQSLGAIFGALSSDPDLAGLHAEIYQNVPGLSDAAGAVPALSSSPPWHVHSIGQAASLRKGFYFCNSLIQLMEDVYLDLRLEQEFRHPDNRGWMSLFRHWSRSDTFRLTWAVAASTYGLRFQEFCRRRLSLSLGVTDLVSVWDREFSTEKNPLDAPRAKEFDNVETRMIDMLMSKSVRGVPNEIEKNVQQILVARLLVPSNLTAERGQIGKRPVTPEERRDVLEVNFGIVAITGRFGSRSAALLTLAIRRELREQGLGRRLIKDLVCRLGVNKIDMPTDEQMRRIGLPTGSLERLENLFRSVRNEVTLSEQRQQAAPRKPATPESAIFGAIPRLPYSGVVRPPGVTWAHAVGFCFWVLAGAERKAEQIELPATKASRDADAAERISEEEEAAVRKALKDWADDADGKETGSIAIESKSWYLGAKRPVEALEPEVDTIIGQLDRQPWFDDKYRRRLVKGLEKIEDSDRSPSDLPSAVERRLVEKIERRLTIFSAMRSLEKSEVERPPGVTWAHAVGFCFWVLTGSDGPTEEEIKAARRALSVWIGHGVDKEAARKESDSIADESMDWYLSARSLGRALEQEVDIIIRHLYAQLWFGKKHKNRLAKGLENIAKADREISEDEKRLIGKIMKGLRLQTPGDF